VSGFTMVSAIFLLVVLAVLGAAIATVFTSQQVTSTADLQGSRAYWAARSAAEYGLMQLLRPEDTTGATSFAACMAVPQNVTLPGISGFTVQITNCRRDTTATYPSDGGVNIAVYSVTALASAGAVGSAFHVEREVTVSAAKCKDPAAKLPDGVTDDTRNRCL
jgi:MSHA biogenesis protein MshP